MGEQHARAWSTALAKIERALENPPSVVEVLKARTNGNDKRHGDARGNVRNRKRRTQRLLDEFGDGQTCPCYSCGRELDAKTITHDRIWPGSMGGSYRYENVLPMCFSCNRRRSDTVIREFIADTEMAMDAPITHALLARGRPR